MRRFILIAAAAAASALAGCEDELPTATSDELVPVDAGTAEILLPFDEVVDDLRVHRGFGRPADLGYGLLADDFRDALEVRTLVRFGDYPESAQVEDTTGTTVPDSALTFVGGRLILRFDTLGVDAGELEGPPQVTARSIQAPWHPETATWEWAVDSVGVQEPWPEAGAGPADSLATAAWDVEESDSLSIEVDSATVAAWGDTANPRRGLRLDLDRPGRRFRLNNVSLELEARPSVNPDTTITVGVPQRLITFVYSPGAEGDPGLRLGGVPAWRTTFRLDVPESIDASPEVCAVLECPVRLTPETLSAATLLLTPEAPPAGFEPEDTVRLDVRPVLRPERLPRSPVGESLLPDPFRLDPELFGVDAARRWS